MKKFTSILLMILFSTLVNAQENYKNLWDKVHKFELENLPKSALNVVEQIYTKAEKEKNTPQLVKTLLYKSKFSLTLEEDAQLKIIEQFKKHINKSEFPTTNVLENILANLYWQYFNQNRWKFYNRTQTKEKVTKEDFRTWDLNTLFEEIHLNFQKSLENKAQLQQIDIYTFSDILNLVKGSKKYRPTLYDFLAHNALDFYKTSETNITKPAYQFKLNDKKYLSDAITFSTLTLESKDSLSLQFNALKIYQDLIRFHIKNNKRALVDVDLHRLQFINKHAVLNEKQEVLLKTLITSQNQLKGNELSGLYAFEVAKIYNEQANTYQPKKNNVYRFKNKEALTICNDIINQFSESKGAFKCEHLKRKILEKTVQLITEEHIPSNKFSKTLITYKNLNEIYFSAYKISLSQLKKFNESYQKKEKIKIIQQLDKVKSWSSNLKDEKDYQQHKSEVIIPKLPIGSYLLMASSSQNLEEAIMGTATIQVTNLALISRENNGRKTYQVVNRNTGEPIEGSTIRFVNRGGRHEKTLNKLFTTNSNGEFTYNPSSYYYNVKATVRYKDDTAILERFYLNKRYKNNDSFNSYIQTFLFTDRSIYRPGQTIHFKGISMKTFKTTSEVLKNKKVTIRFRDVNHQVLKTFDLKTNDFGSFSSTLIIPNTGLTGSFTIEAAIDDRTHTTQISVEEYKRPKFETDFKPITKAYKVNDSIAVNGFAKAYSGANITNAKVVYRVHRKVQYPRWWYWYRPSFISEPQEINFGESTTDTSGNFSIKFKALADESVSKENLPVFTYEITADVTDINGETRSATTLVKVGYHSLIAAIEMEKTIDKSIRNNTLKINTKNLNDEFVPANGTIKIYKLQAPKNPLRKRPWKSPDYQIISKEEFASKFPNEAYQNEDNPLQWEKDKLVFETKFNTAKEKEIQLRNIKKWSSGNYVVELLATDKFNQEVTDKHFFSVYSIKDNLPIDNKIVQVKADKKDYQPGEFANITVSTNSQDITVMLFVEKKHQIVDSYYIKLNKNSKTIRIPVTKDDIGGFGITYYFTNYNSFEQGALSIAVPYPKTDLNIITKTFRDKLQPGAKETWSFTIKGTQKDKLTAELLAGMYDASLDQFKSHQWRFNPIQRPIYHTYSNASANQSFRNTHFRIENYLKNKRSHGMPNQSYDRLNWFGFSFTNNRLTNREYLRNLSIQRTSFEGTISGIVEDETGPLPGVTVVIKGTNYGTETDFDGKFTIKVNKGDVLVFSLVGTKTIERTVGNFKELFIGMESSNTLDEVVITAYGNTNKNIRIRGRASAPAMAKTTGGWTPENVASEEIEDEESAFAYDTNLAKKIEEQKRDPLKGIQIRKNLQETAFFYPHLTTDTNGNVSFNFTAPETLTKWKVQLLVHTKELHSAVETLEAVTQKELMVTPNAPRFLREGDKITISSKISNLSGKKLQGLAQLILTDALTGKSIDVNLGNTQSQQSFVVDKKGNTNVSWNLSIPETIQAVQYQVVAKAGDFSDGEQNALPVLSNRMLVTETLPIWVRSNQTKTFSLDKLKNNTSSSLKNHKLTLEVTSNPAWYAVQALPYLMEYPYECSEQTFARYYANTLASYIANKNPRIQEVFNSWKSSEALLSNLEKNEELKSLIIQETPWLRDAQSETEQKKRIALLFDLNHMKNKQQKTLNKLYDFQMNNGGFPWFKGSRYPNAYITNHIATGFGHLQHLSVKDFDNKTTRMIKKAIQFLDVEVLEQYKRVIKEADKIRKKEGATKAEKYLNQKHIGNFQLQYLYMRSFFKNVSIEKGTKEAIAYYRNQAVKFWKDFNLYGKAQIALFQHRNGDPSITNKILKSLKETSITSDELGMYWKSNQPNWRWYQAPIETQALLIEAFSEIENDTKTVDNLKIWLLKNKQVSQWKTTKATTEAVYALLLQGSDWISITDMVDVSLGNKIIDPSKIEDIKVEAGTGYFKTSWNGSEIQPEMAEITLTKKNKGIAWGGVYWQYFEDLDKITSAETPLKLKKKLFKKVNSDTGKKLVEITNTTSLKVGDLLTVRIVLQSDRNMEFIHMKDMRASGVEPVDVLSQYKWQDGLGYYQSTKDAATNFFFDYLPKGVYVFEYDVRVNNAGDFSNGITTIQNMYAPEFSSHSKGTRITVK
ncbi:MG2 domain-containing protein [uncultured Tenacibaculum sp.]|uniref:alpha-2-macroglobulin family protein n=1 Tax=uncultured Tenacibaculum sp. TaxID=174713 RepID=UPI00260BD199|nr:MG2 domain-containing protein [uncultured Tenacibaculum sp.]